MIKEPKSYLDDDTWQQIADLIPEAKAGGRPAKYSRRELVEGILHILCESKPWRSLPKAFPPWNTVYVYYQRWRKSGIWPQVVERLKRTELSMPCDLT